MPLTAFALNCSLKASGDKERSSTDRLLAGFLAARVSYEVKGESCALDHDIKPLCTFGYGHG